MSEETIALLVERKVPIVTTFAPVVVQSQPEIARKFNIPEWKIAERQKAVADPKRYEGLVNAAEGRRDHRVRHRLRKPGGGA